MRRSVWSPLRTQIQKHSLNAIEFVNRISIIELWHFAGLSFCYAFEQLAWVKLSAMWMHLIIVIAEPFHSSMCNVSSHVINRLLHHHFLILHVKCSFVCSESPPIKFFRQNKSSKVHILSRKNQLWPENTSQCIRSMSVCVCFSGP